MATRRHQFRGMAVGIGMTAVVATLFCLGALESAENVALDLRQRWFNRFDVDPRIVHIDIDDGSISRIGRWPWPHDVVADLLRMIHESAVQAVAVDLLFDKFQYRVPDDPASKLNPDIETPPRTLVAGEAGNLVYPTAELADAIRHAGNVFLSTHLDIRSAQTDRRPLDEQAQQLLAAEPAMPPEGLRARLRAAASDQQRVSAAEAARLWLGAKLSLLLQSDFGRGERSLAQPWAQLRQSFGTAYPELSLSNLLPDAKRRVAEARAAEILREQPDAKVETLCRRLGLDPDNPGSDREIVKVALERRLGLREVLLRTPPLPPDLAARKSTPVGLNLIPPYYLLARAARGLGGVSVDPDAVFRRLPLVVDVQGHALPHLGLAVAAAALHLDLSQISMPNPRTLKVPSTEGPAYLIPLDEAGQFVVHWSPSDATWSTQDNARHIPASKLLEAASDRHAMEANAAQAELYEAQVVDTSMGGATRNGRKIDVVGAFVAKASSLKKLRRELHQAELDGREDEPQMRAKAAEVARLRDEIAKRGAKSASFVRDRLAEADDALHQLDQGKLDLQPGETPAQARASLQEQRAPFAEAVQTLKLIDTLRAKNRELTDRISATLSELRLKLQDRFAFVGFTATAEGDIVPTAIHGKMPGVIAHASVLNSFLQRRFIRFPPPGAELALVILMGAVATFLTASLGFRDTVLSVAMLLVGFVAFNTLVLFRHWDIKLELASVVAVILFTSVPVTFYRWRTADTQRREIRGQLAQYTSPALASRIADDPEFVEHWTRVEPREVTCFVSDLKGFTTLAEQTDDPARTRAALNIYLDHMSEVLDRHQALINKFMGDGIFAFFNPPVLPQPDTHPREACEAALDCHEALRQLKADQAAQGTDDLIQHFEMRIGLATGVAGVGDFGSSRKKDYTIIGDVANLAARLESANKVFGTSLMISGPTRDAVAALYEFRYLADLQVKGKQRTVPVYEVLGRKGQVPDDLLMNAEAFAMGVEMYKRREWDACTRHFTRLLSRRPDDPGPGAYIDACREKKLFPPDEEWAGALELKEK